MQKYLFRVIVLMLLLTTSTYSQSFLIGDNKALDIKITMKRSEAGDGYSVHGGVSHNGNFDFGFFYSYQEIVYYTSRYSIKYDIIEEQTITASYNTSTIGTYFNYVPIKLRAFSFILNASGYNTAHDFFKDGILYFDFGSTLALNLPISYESKIVPILSWIQTVNLTDNKSEDDYLTYGVTYSYKNKRRDSFYAEIIFSKEDYSTHSFSIGYSYNLGL